MPSFGRWLRAKIKISADLPGLGILLEIPASMFTVPQRSVALLIGIGLIDLIATSILHAKGLIVELNPVMRVFIERGEWLFALVKGLTLVLAGVVMWRHIKKNPKFVNQMALIGSGAYVFIWSVWFFGTM